MVVLEVGGNTVSVLGTNEERKRIREAIEPIMRYQPQGFMYSPKYKSGEWDGWISLYHPWGIAHFPRGFLEEAEEILTMMDIPYTTSQGAEDGGVALSWPHCPLPLQSREYQNEAIEKAIAMKRGIICLPTGTGKTHVALEIIRKLGKTAVIFVHKKELAIQWATEIHKRFNTRDGVGIVGDGLYEPKEITVAMVQTASKLPAGIFHGYGITIFDECHHVAAESIFEIAERSTSEYLLGLSATPFRADGKDIVLRGGLGSFIVNLNVSDMIHAGWLAKPTIWLYDVSPQAYPRRIKFSDVYRDYIVDNAERNGKIIKAAEHYRALGLSVYIHVKQIRHGEVLHAKIPGSVWVHGRDKTEVRTAAIENFAKSGGIMISTLLGEGVDVPGMNVLILGCGGQSEVFVRQLIGRVLRLTADKKAVTIIDFMDCARFLADHAEERKALYESEPAFEVKTP